MKIVYFALFLIAWYSIVFTNFIEKDFSNQDSPQLRARFGTVMWHSSGQGGEEHLYCYYPKGTATYTDKGGEYILKRVEKLNDCSNWFGMATFNEGAWVSEREKIWWSRNQKIADDLNNHQLLTF